MKNSNKNIYIYDLNNSWINTNNTSKSSLLETSNLIENNNNEFIDDKHIIAIDTYINLEKLTIITKINLIEIVLTTKE